MKQSASTTVSLILLVFLTIQLLPSASMAWAEPSAEFAWPAPSKESRPGCYWWWPGSAVDRENITWNLETLKQAGIGGVTLVPIYGVKGAEDRFLQYLSPKWLQMLDHTVGEAERLGMWVDMTTGTGWPFGGPDVLPADACLSIAYEKGELTPKTASRHVERAAPGGEGLTINPYSQRALETYLKKFDRAFATSKIRLPRAQYHDSFEYKGNWCDDFLAEFKDRRGYDLGDHAPALFGRGDPDMVARIKGDYRETLSDLHLRYINTWDAWAEKQGCITRNQAHGAPANLLDLYAASDIPETEVFGANVFKIPGLRREADNVCEEVPEPLVNRFASSAAHVAGKRLVASESCTWIRNHFRTALSQVKPEIDHLFLAGVNHVFYHGCCYSPRDASWPGWLFYASLEANPRNTIWRDIGVLNAYVTRCQSILQSGQPANDVLLYWPVHDLWHSPEGMEKRFQVHHPDWLTQTNHGAVSRRLVDRGYAFDFISDRQLQDSNCDQGHILAPSGLSYQTVLVPKTEHMPLETFERLVSLASEGATVVFHRQLPADVPGFGDLEHRREQFQQQLDALDFKRLAQNNIGIRMATVGKGRLLVGEDVGALLTEASVRREAMVDSGLRFIRRSHREGYHYFVTNFSDRPIQDWFELEHEFQSAVILDPLSQQTGVADLRKDRDRVELFLQLSPGETRIVRTFTTKSVKGDPWPTWSPAGNPRSITGQWNVDFIEGGPQMPASFNTTQLKSWTLLGDENADRFGGTARYHLEFELPEIQADDWLLDLGDVRESARLKINGQEAGTLISFPFSIHVGQYLRTGKNVFDIEVTNLAANRIRDLDIRGVSWKIFHEINFVDQNYEKFDASKWPLTESGLLGPIRLVPLTQGKNKKEE